MRLFAFRPPRDPRAWTLAACAGPVSREVVASVPITGVYAQRSVTLHGPDGEPARFAAHAMLAARDGRALLCGFYATEGDSGRLGPRVLPGLVAGTEVWFDDEVFLAGLQGLAGPLPMAGLREREADCLALPRDWRPGFEDVHRIRFRIPPRLLR